MSTPNTDLWDKVLTLRCADCGRVERDIYAALVRESRFKVVSTASPHSAAGSSTGVSA